MTLASVGTISGPAASTLLGNLQGVQLWTKYINQRGGLNGRYLVKLLVYDDGGDPARHRAQVQEAVEQRGAIGFLVNIEVLTGRGSLEYIAAKRVPVIGTDTGEEYVYSNPMYFPQTSSGYAVMRTGLANAARQALPRGKKKLATLACVEAQLCTDADRIFGEEAAKRGFELVYRSKASITQPDFTAECLAASSAGAQVFLTVMDTNSTYRVASSCARQGFKPLYATVSSIVTDRFAKDPSLSALVASSNVFPYFRSDTPATAEYQQALRQLGPDVPPGPGPALGWVGGKLLERAVANLGSEPPTTSEALLRGLWSIKNDDLGGLTHPLTFTANQPAVAKACWFGLAIANGKWISPDNYELHCLD